MSMLNNLMALSTLNWIIIIGAAVALVVLTILKKRGQ
jgi:hypothetical protein